MQKYIIEEIECNISNFENMKKLSALIEQAAFLCIEAIRNGNKIIFCGNGGSAADAQHLAAELVGRYKKNRPAMNATALTVDTSILTAISNDYGYEEVFARQLEGLGKEGDILIGISTSGNSRNVLKAFEKAEQLGIKKIAFTGENGGEMKKSADICINVPSQTTNHIQEMHITAGHIICGLIEEKIYG